MFSRYPKQHLREAQGQQSRAEETATVWFALPAAVIAVVVYGFVLTVDRSLAPFDAPTAMASSMATGAAPATDYFPARFENTATEPAEPVGTF